MAPRLNPDPLFPWDRPEPMSAPWPMTRFSAREVALNPDLAAHLRARAGAVSYDPATDTYLVNDRMEPPYQPRSEDHLLQIIDRFQRAFNVRDHRWEQMSRREQLDMLRRDPVQFFNNMFSQCFAQHRNEVGAELSAKMRAEGVNAELKAFLDAEGLADRFAAFTAARAHLKKAGVLK